MILVRPEVCVDADAASMADLGGTIYWHLTEASINLIPEDGVL
jgi:hypothetical protein